jgi:ABC-type phosphate transport system substrate-binding protein
MDSKIASLSMFKGISIQCIPVTCAVFAMVLGMSLPVNAADCTALPSPVYLTGSTAARPLLAEIGKYLSAQIPPTSIVYLGQGSCAGVDAVLNGTPLVGAGATALSIWDSSGTEQKCDVPTTATLLADIGISDVFATTCFALPGGLPSNVTDILGPVQSMTFAVPKGSPERSISAEAAYYVYGFGSASGVLPWTDDSILFRRDELSGTQRMIAAAIGVPATRWKGTGTTGSGDLVKKLTAASPREGALGIVAADVAEDNRAILDVLAYQHTGQSCGYYPNHDATSNDKRNVRDGHYAIWGPLHLLTRVDGSGYPVKRTAADVAGYLAGTKTAPAQLDLIYLEAQHHVVPQCAMRVRRTEDMGPMMPFAPSGACGCYFERAANGVTTCQACQKNADCPQSASVCSYGYCEIN